MSSIRLLAPVIAFGVSLAATGVVGSFARRRGLLDQPDATRRTHRVATPRLAGIGMLSGIAASLGVLALLGFPLDVPLGWLVGAIGFFLVGLSDDLAPRGRGLDARWKFALMAAVAVGVVSSGVRFDGAGSGPWPDLEFGVATAPLTVVWILAVVNVVNFMDGIDALAGAVAAVVLAAAFAAGPESISVIDGAAAGAVIGFLVWNAPRARIFMGDGGSYLLGFLIAVAPCRIDGSVTAGGGTSGIASTPWPLVGAALVASIVDVGEALLHKGRSGIPMLQPHHDHLYQRLVRAGHPAGLVALRYAALTLVAIAIAGPLAERVGAALSTGIGLVVLAAHLLLGRRATSAVPRLAARDGAP